MSEHAALIAPAAAAFSTILRGIGDTELTARTPCAEYDVRALLNHLLYWGPWLEAAGRKAPPPEVATGEAKAALVGADWLDAAERQTARLVDVFGTPEAWQGMTALGTTEMPASIVGDMVLGEFVFHGWDLARAIGRTVDVAPEAAEAVYASAAAMGEQARSMKVYGEEVVVAEGATTFERALGATGRNPAWTA
ncbi:TIGR03086 family metal-binding protein [Amycolatopsis oliviviridis]|uniref:TIGR03086 family protein n=1 Tax=Amycolatopsis oliviviridis TaxID=1471590 RepID=A0ABQ3LRI0_9PSEU|nr:TIGR03086 family metal-binding protein [Amycolatopsis oliviviridis]GHH24198.1 TIGR03086 family protein [Amycolatopsis oliviviridis]